jgi:hypothetical protein
MNGLTKEDFEDWMWRLQYVEVVISYKGQRYHIESFNKKYVIGLFEKKEYRIKEWIEVVGNSDEEAFQKLMNEPLFSGEALKNILDKIEWLEG